MILKGQNIDYDSLTSRNQSLSFEILEKKLKEKLSISKITKDILISFGLYSNNIGFNNAAELVSDINSSQSIDIVRFGKDINEILDREIYKSISIIEQFDKSVELFRKYYQKEVIVGIARKKVEMIPEKAFREALANALVHRVWDIK